MAEFDLSALMKDVSKMDTGREQISYLPYAALIPDPNNGYSMDGLDGLARSIELVGLQQPLRVKELSPGHYGLISGHRRHAAIGLILKQDPAAFADGVPCIIDRADGSVALRELQLLLGNADNRKLTPADEAQQLERISDCIRRLEAEGYVFPGRHRDWLSKMSGMSKSKIGRLEAIRRNLATSLIDDFNAGCLSVTTAYRLSQETPEIQMSLAKMAPSQVLSALNERELEDQINRCKTSRSDPTPTAEPNGSSFDVEGYLETRRKEDDDFFELLNGVAKMLTEPLGALNSRSEGIEKLKTEFGKCWRGGWNGKVDYECRPKGLTLQVPGSDKIFRTWTEVYDMLCTIALNRAATGSGWDDDEDDEADEEELDAAPELPTVRWTSRAQTPPIGEPLLLYELTNVGPVYTTAKYKGGATFCKPGRPGSYGKELTGMAQRFTMWLQFPDPEKFGAAFRVGDPAPVPEMDTAPEWQSGDPNREGVYWCKFLINGQLLTRAARWYDETWHFNNIDTDIRALCVGWWPLPEEE